jgi:hypothetical protein
VNLRIAAAGRAPPRGRHPERYPLWISDVLPGNVHDLAAGIARAALVLVQFEHKMTR